MLIFFQCICSGYPYERLSFSSSILPLCHIWQLCPHLECRRPCVRLSALSSLLWLLVNFVGWHSSRQHHLSLLWWLHLSFQILSGKEAKGSALGQLLQLSSQLAPVLPVNTSSNVIAPNTELSRLQSYIQMPPWCVYWRHKIHITRLQQPETRLLVLLHCSPTVCSHSCPARQPLPCPMPISSKVKYP